MRRVRIAHAVRKSSGAEQCEYSSRKWCSTAQRNRTPVPPQPRLLESVLEDAARSRPRRRARHGELEEETELHDGAKSVRPVSRARDRRSTECTMASTMAPSTAGRKPSIANPGTNPRPGAEKRVQDIRKRPKVRIVSGKVRIFRTKPIVEFTRLITSAATSARRSCSPRIRE